MRSAEQWMRAFHGNAFDGEITPPDMTYMIGEVQRETIAAVRTAVEAKLIGGALSLKGLTAMDQAEIILAVIDAVEVA